MGRLNPLYANHVQEGIQRLGREHPLIHRQYYCEEIDAQTGMFPVVRQALMFASTPAGSGGAEAGTGAHAFLIDVAGQDENRMGMYDDEGLSLPGRNSTTLSIVQIDLGSLATLQGPVFRMVERAQWTGASHLTIFGQIKALAERWNPLKIVVDATGVGDGLWTMLERVYPSRVTAVRFTQFEKSEIGWRFLAVIETGRFRILNASEAVRQQYTACRSEILPGPGKVMRWGVPESLRGDDGELIHDDHLMADALVAVLDRMEWVAPTHSRFVQAAEPDWEGKY